MIRWGVSQCGTTRTIVFNEGGNVTAGAVITSQALWLRSSWNEQGNSQFSTSVDGTRFTDMGRAYSLKWGNYRGDRIGIYNFNSKAESGVVDVDWLHYRFKPGN